MVKYKIWFEKEGKEFEFERKKELYKFLREVDLSRYEFKAWVEY